METSVKLDDQLLNKAKQLSHIYNTDEVIQRALERYVTVLQANQRLLEMRGKIEFWNDESQPTSQL
ncbi:type II toxin-antitoxin system VapB family antitoxin [Spirosoma soli]|uniref:Type II toxin-antitoxin system VapB family antitoxin n=1 Tax=Spirosoma soli TaxID=1770529 RepID=A0ABW5M968_9BACT